MHQPVAAAAHLRAQGQQTGRRSHAKIQVAIGVVFHHRGLVPHGQLQHLVAPRQAERGAAGVAKSGDEVDELRPVFGHELFQLVGFHAVLVDRRGNHLRAVETKTLNGGQKGRPLHDHLVAGVDQGLADQVERLLAAGGDDQLVRRHDSALGRHEGAELLAQRLVAFGGAVLQRRAGLFAQGLVDGLADTVHVEHGGVRKAAGKADDAGLSQQLEEFTDGGGFNIVQAVGKLHESLSFMRSIRQVGCAATWPEAGFNYYSGFAQLPQRVQKCPIVPSYPHFKPA